jgi:hypothetical protein
VAICEVDVLTPAVSLCTIVTVRVPLLDVLIVIASDGVSDTETDGERNGSVEEAVPVSVGVFCLCAAVVVSLGERTGVRVDVTVLVVVTETTTEGLSVPLKLSSCERDSLRDVLVLAVHLNDSVPFGVMVFVTDISLVYVSVAVIVPVKGVVTVFDAEMVGGGVNELVAA